MFQYAKLFETVGCRTKSIRGRPNQFAFQAKKHSFRSPSLSGVEESHWHCPVPRNTTSYCPASLLGVTKSFHSSKYTRDSISATANTLAADDNEEEEDSFTEEAQILEEIDKGTSGLSQLSPSESFVVVAELDKFIIGQNDAKKAVAIALRNRWRRHQIPQSLRDEVIPKNLLLIGPTGCGKTEIARRVAKLQKAPFVKVEATKYTEVGYHGKDVDTIISDLVEIAIHQTKQNLTEKIKDKLKKKVDNVLLKHLTGSKDTANFRALLETGALEKTTIEYQAKVKASIFTRDLFSSFDADPSRTNNPAQRAGATILPIELFKPPAPQKKKITVGEYRKILEAEEFDKLLTLDTIKKKAIEAVEQDGIVFIDEIDKICVRPDTLGTRASASDEGVQRDLLPIIEGTTVSTKYGNIDTSKILFICSGAFHACKPSDLLPELQGRLPIRVELKGLTRDDLVRILTQTDNSLIKQQIELLKPEGIALKFEDDAIHEIATIAYELNDTIENIGARRLHTVIEKVVEECSFNSHKYKSQEFIITKEYVRQTLAPLLVKTDLTKFIL